MASVLNSASLPSTMEDKLRAIRRRLVLLSVARACAFGAAALMVAMIVVMGLDWWLTLFSTTIRVALTSASLILGVAALLATGVRPLIDAMKFARAASDADGEVPQLEERWTTVASFATSKHQPTSATARAMLQQVTSEAVALGRLVKPAQVAKPAALKPALLALSGSGFLLVAFLATNWAQTSVLLHRFWSPLQNITATQLASVTGDRVVPRGERLELIVEQAGVRHAVAKLEVEGRDGILDVFEMNSNAKSQGAFAYELPVDNSFRYRVSAGDGQTQWHQVTAIDYPELAEVRLTVSPPEYVDRPPYEKSVIPSRVKVVQGSRLKLMMKPAAALERLELQLVDHLRGPGGEDQSSRRAVVLDPQPDGWYRFETQLVDDLSLSPTLLNAHGLKNEDKRVCRFQVVADKAPVARIVSPTDEMAVAVDDVIDIKFEAHDDFGIATAELVVYDESAKDENGQSKILAVKEIELGDEKLAPHIMGKTQLDLKELRLKEGTNISYAIRVTDNRDLQLDREAMAARRALASAEKEAAEDAANGQGDRREDRMMADATDAQEKSRRAGASQKDGKRTDSQQNNPGANRVDELPAKMLAKASENDEPSDAKKSVKSAAASDSKSTADGKNGDSDSKDSPAAVATKSSNDKTGDQPNDNTDDPKAVAATKPGDMPGKENSKNGKTASAKKGAASADAKSVAADDADNAQSKSNGDATKPKGRQVAAVDPKNGAPRMPDDQGKGNAKTPGKDDGMKDDGAGQPSDSKDANGQNEKKSGPGDGKSPDSEGTESNSKKNGSGNPRDESADKPSNETPQSPNGDEKMTDEDKRDSNNSNDKNNNSNAGGNGSPRKQENSEEGVPRERMLAMSGQQATSAQNAETGKRRLRITERLMAFAEAASVRSENMQIRDRIVHLDRLLKGVEEALTRVVDRNIPDADRAEQFRRVDKQIGDIESAIAELREETKEKQFAFVGLQMVHIGTTHVTPARDRVFASIREPQGTDNPKVALHHITRAREMLDALLKRYERVAREEALADAIDESVKMYEVYVEKMQSLMREARQNMNPLRRKMAVIEVDQDYLDRYAEVEKLRREMMTEFGRMLGDDPRLLARYLDILRRRGKSLRDRLTELAQRQDEVSTELNGWLQVGEVQRDDLWTIVAELRLQAATPLAKEADGLLERTQQSMPLLLKEDEGTAALVLKQADKVARTAREITMDARKALQPGTAKDAPSLTAHAEKLVELFGDLDAALDQLNFENEGTQEVTDYVNRRLIESRTVADQADAWTEVARFLESKSYNGLAEIDQRTVAIATELLRIEMLGMEADLETQFQQVAKTSLPGEIADMIRDLHRVMEGITFTQNAASFALTRNRLEGAEIQEQKSLDGFDRAQKLFDLIRKAVVAALDEYKVDNPNIAELQDPTLDRFLAQLEREPDIEAQLGIPNRPRNLRVLAESMTFQQEGGNMLGDASNTARRRAMQAMQMTQNGGKQKPEEDKKPQKPDAELTDEERKEREQEKQRQQMLEKTLASVQEKLDDPKTPPEQKEKLEQMAQNMKRMLDQNSSQHSAAEEWERIVESDQAKEALRALATGQRLPDSQWNKLLSTLDDGLWQVRGRKPPEDYRKAIEQYQERLRKLIGTTGNGDE